MPGGCQVPALVLGTHPNVFPRCWGTNKTAVQWRRAVVSAGGAAKVFNVACAFGQLVPPAPPNPTGHPYLVMWRARGRFQLGPGVRSQTPFVLCVSVCHGTLIKAQAPSHVHAIPHTDPSATRAAPSRIVLSFVQVARKQTHLWGLRTLQK